MQKYKMEKKKKQQKQKLGKFEICKKDFWEKSNKEIGHWVTGKGKIRYNKGEKEK